MHMNLKVLFILAGFLICGASLLAQVTIEIQLLTSGHAIIESRQTIDFEGEISGFEKRLVVDAVSLPGIDEPSLAGARFVNRTHLMGGSVGFPREGAAIPVAGRLDRRDFVIESIGREVLRSFSNDGSRVVRLSPFRLFVNPLEGVERLAGSRTMFLLSEDSTRTSPFEVTFVVRLARDLLANTELALLGRPFDGLSRLQVRGNEFGLQLEVSGDLETWHATGLALPDGLTLEVPVIASTLGYSEGSWPVNSPGSIWWRLSPGQKADERGIQNFSVRGKTMSLGFDASADYRFDRDGTGLLRCSGSRLTLEGVYPITWSETVYPSLTILKIERSDGAVECHYLRARTTGDPSKIAEIRGMMIVLGDKADSRSFTGVSNGWQYSARDFPPPFKTLPEIVPGDVWSIGGFRTGYLAPENITMIFEPEGRVRIENIAEFEDGLWEYESRQIGLDVMSFHLFKADGSEFRLKLSFRDFLGGMAFGHLSFQSDGRKTGRHVSLFTEEHPGQ